MVEWISVKDGLPKNGLARVLVHVKKDGMIGFPQLDTDRYANESWVRWGKYVTHWMPLPKPPKEGEHETD